MEPHELYAGLRFTYLLADRYTPYTQQARLQAYVVPVAAEVAGQIKRVAAPGVCRPHQWRQR